MEQLRPFTWDDLAIVPDDLLTREIIDGELIVSPSPHFLHQRLVFRTGRMIEDAGIGVGIMLVAPMDVRLTAYDVVQPDVLFIRNDHLGILAADGRITGVPDIVVEIVSPGSERVDRVRKFALYARAGVPEYWILDYRDRALAINELRDGRYHAVAAEADGRIRSKVLPNLAVSAEDLFAGIPPLD